MADNNERSKPSGGASLLGGSQSIVTDDGTRGTLGRDLHIIDVNANNSYASGSKKIQQKSSLSVIVADNETNRDGTKVFDGISAGINGKLIIDANTNRVYYIKATGEVGSIKDTAGQAFKKTDEAIFFGTIQKVGNGLQLRLEAGAVATQIAGIKNGSSLVGEFIANLSNKNFEAQVLATTAGLLEFDVGPKFEVFGVKVHPYAGLSTQDGNNKAGPYVGINARKDLGNNFFVQGGITHNNTDTRFQVGVGLTFGGSGGAVPPKSASIDFDSLEERRELLKAINNDQADPKPVTGANPQNKAVNPQDGNVKKDATTGKSLAANSPAAGR